MNRAQIVAKKVDIKSVEIGTVEVFRDPKPDKAQALKVLEEAAEVFAAWQRCARDEWADEFYLTDMLDECADVIQAVCNLSAAFGVSSLVERMDECRKRNVRRGRM